ncbi:MAG: HlyD family efflux transporter periplasmic adaptor subunit [Candidatus Wallbacteria bacterium]|nr:HlyD family efflux transporter periplasmic adaptor subunit [Candidatus Wallbacteria bacterium]
MTVKEVLEEGIIVKKGDNVLTMDDSQFQKDLETAKNDLDTARAELESEKFDLENNRVMLDLDIKRKELALAKAKLSVVDNSVLISKVDLEKAKLEVKMAELELNQANESRKDFNKQYDAGLKMKTLRVETVEKKIKNQQENITNSMIKAPREGVVFKPFVRLNNETGRVEKGKVISPGDKLLDILNLGSYEGVIYVTQSEVRFLNQGDSLSVSLTAFPEKKFKAVVLSKAQYPQTRNDRLGRNDPEGYLKEYEVIIEIGENDPALKPGMSFKAEITSIIATECVYIPNIAIGNDKKGSFVISEKGKKYLTLGKSSLNFTEVKSGLSKGEKIQLDNQTGSGTAAQ